MIKNPIKEVLKRHPLLYGLIGSVAVILFWRGIWNTADALAINHWVSAIIGFAILIIIGLFTSSFISEDKIVKEVKQEEKQTEKVAKEEKGEEEILEEIKQELDDIHEDVEKMKRK